MFKIDKLNREDIPKLWEIDRSEVIEYMYRVYDNSRLEQYPHYEVVDGWPPGEEEKYNPILLDCYDNGGLFYAIRNEEDNKIIGGAVLESKKIGPDNDLLTLVFLFVSSKQRGKGLGKILFKHCVEQAKTVEGCNGIYVSAIPSKTTVDFYMGLQCKLIDQPDEELFKREPLDVHLYYKF